jgi:hypothetical protein
LGNESSNTLVILDALGTEYTRRARYTEAEPAQREAMTGMVRQLGAYHPNTLREEHNLAITLIALNKSEEALPLAKDVYDRLEESGKVDEPPNRRAMLRSSYGICLSRLGRHEEAVSVLTGIRAEMLAAGLRNSMPLQRVLTNLVTSATALNRSDDVARWSAELTAVEAATRAAATAPASQPATLPTKG